MGFIPLMLIIKDHSSAVGRVSRPKYGLQSKSNSGDDHMSDMGVHRIVTTAAPPPRSLRTVYTSATPTKYENKMAPQYVAWFFFETSQVG